MTKAFKYLSYMLVGAACAGAVWSCTDDTYSIPEPNITPAELVEGVAFTVDHDADNPNIIHLKSLMPAEYQIAWVTPQGRKTGNEATLAIPFDGNYEVQMGVDTRGGYVWSEPYTFTIQDFCADFVDHYLWRRLSGGVGQSKTWQLDLAVLTEAEAASANLDMNTWAKTVKDGVSYYVKSVCWTGPHWYWNSNYTWDHLHAAAETESTYANYIDSDPWDKTTAINPETVPENSSGDAADWYWAADFAGNNWMCSPKNYGYITFDLIDGANVTITDASGNIIGKGTYMLDTDAHTIAFSDCYPLETDNQITHVRDFKLFYLSDYAMQILPDLPNVNAASLNYVTKDYFEAYSKPAPSVITLPETWYEDLNVQIKYSAWRIDPDTPFGYYSKGGELDQSRKPMGADKNTLDKFRINLCEPEPGMYFIDMPDGSEIEGQVEISKKGTISFSNGIGSSNLGGGITLEGSNFTIVGIDYDNVGRVSSFILGVPQNDGEGNLVEYLGYKFAADYGVEQKKTYKATLTFSQKEIWSATEGTPVIVSEGKTVTATVYPGTPWDDEWNSNSDIQPLLWLDVYNLAKEQPNCDVVILSIKIDGQEIEFRDSDISRDLEGAEKGDARRYICNAWGLAPCFPSTSVFRVKNSAEVSFTVIYDAGKPYGSN
ncbi:MAG: hypothetical protein K2F77_04645 [Muribaculaceae bacterium]|nr:hypothetical protein [Muribaculaceae bacterium]